MQLKFRLPSFIECFWGRGSNSLTVDPDTVNRFERKKLKAACALNMCMVSLSQIVDYQDLEILKMEYDTILNNLNLENIVKDEALLKALQGIMDACHFYILHAKDKEMLKKKQQARLKDVLPSALGKGNLIAIFNGNPWAMMAGAAVMVGVAAVNYKSQREKAKLENDIEEWQLERSALEQLHNLRRTLFETAWRFAKKYNYPDSYRLTEKQISIYNEIIKNPDPQTRYESLWLIRDSFKAYPIFWYYLGRAALETADAFREDAGDNVRKRLVSYGAGDNALYNAYCLKAKEAYQIFKRCHLGNELMREDLIAASAYLDHAELCNVSNAKELQQILDDTNRAFQLASMDVEVVQTCAFRYLQLMGLSDDLRGCHKPDGSRAVSDDEINTLPKRAEFCLRFLLDRDHNAEINGRAISLLYKKTNQHREYTIVKALIARRCPFVYARLLPWNSQGFMEDWSQYLSGSGIKRTAFNLYYACTWMIYRDFFLAMNEAKRIHSYEPLKTFRDYLKHTFGGSWTENLYNPQVKASDPREGQDEKGKALETISDVADTLLDVADAVSNPFWYTVKAVWAAKVEQERQNHDKSLTGLMQKLLDDSFERVAWKLFLATRVSEYEPTKFESLLGEIDDALISDAKIKAENFALSFAENNRGKEDILAFANWDEEASTEEPEAFRQIISMEHEAERLRGEIQGLLGEDSRFWFPNPKFKEFHLPSQSIATAKVIEETKSIRSEVIQQVESHYLGQRRAIESITDDDLDALRTEL